jgi:hypothetical protein
LQDIPETKFQQSNNFLHPMSVNPNPPTIFQEDDNDPQEKSSKFLFIFACIFVVVVVIAVLALLIYLRMQSDYQAAKKAKATISPTPIEVIKPVLVKDEWTFEVLNGSGTTGAAKKAASELENSGYMIIEIGNADTGDYEKNKLYVTSDMLDKADLLIEDLKNDFNISSVSGVFVSSTTASARLIIGQE